MRIPKGFGFRLAAVAAMCLRLVIPSTTSAAGDPAATGDPAPAASSKAAAAAKPDIQKKIWTNDDVARLNPAFSGTRVAQAAAARSQVQPAIARPGAAATVMISPPDPQKDPGWYAQQVTSLEAELAAVESHEAELQRYRASGSTISTSGLVLNAPCVGITTDNLIAQLDVQRQDIEQQIDSLGDLARSNGIAPGVLADPGSYTPAARQPTIEEQRDAVIDQARDAADQLAEIQDSLAGMHDQFAAQGITLLQPRPGEGGNMTTDLLSRLDNRASALQNEIKGAEDDARALGVPPAAVP